MDFPRHLVETTFCQVIPHSKVQTRANGKLLINAPCPICGDGTTKKRRRFYLYEKHGHFNVECKNCFYGKSFNNFLKEYYSDTYENLLQSCLGMIGSGKIFQKEKVPEIFQKKMPDSKINKFLKFYFNKCCIKLNSENINPKLEKVRKYCISVMKKRGLPEKIWSNYYFCYKGQFKWRVLIPFIDKDGLYYNFQARDVHPNPDEERKAKKYIFAQFKKIELPDDKIYKQYLVDPNKTVYICEGILDSEFVENSVAVCGVSIGGDRYEYIKNKLPDRIFCLDSPWTDYAAWEVIGKLLKQDEKCFMMPEEHKDCKDMNDLAKKLGVEIISEEYIKKNTLNGIKAEYQFALLTRGIHEKRKPIFKPKPKKDMV